MPDDVFDIEVWIRERATRYRTGAAGLRADAQAFPRGPLAGTLKAVAALCDGAADDFAAILEYLGAKSRLTKRSEPIG